MDQQNSCLKISGAKTACLIFVEDDAMMFKKIDLHYYYLSDIMDLDWSHLSKMRTGYLEGLVIGA